jgi:hypothetical protein
MSDLDIFFYSNGVILVLISLGSVYQGFGWSKKKKQAEANQFSSFGYCAFDQFIECQGKVIYPVDKRIAPLSKKECNAFIWKIERLSSAKGSWWTYDSTLYSDDFIVVEDLSGGKAILSTLNLDTDFLESKVTHKVRNLFLWKNEDILAFRSKHPFLQKRMMDNFIANYRITEYLLSDEKNYYFSGKFYPLEINQVSEYGQFSKNNYHYINKSDLGSDTFHTSRCSNVANTSSNKTVISDLDEEGIHQALGVKSKNTLLWGLFFLILGMLCFLFPTWLKS